MSFSTLVLGESGSGKSTSLRNFDPSKVLLIQPIRKSLPFRSKGWEEFHKTTNGTWDGSIFVSSDPLKIINAMLKSTRPVIVIDDWQYILAEMFMSRRNEKSYDKFTQIGGAGYDICTVASNLPYEKRVYILAHTTEDETGRTRCKTLGKMLDDKICVEGLFTRVIQTHYENDEFLFAVHRSVNDVVKTPIGMFSQKFIPNDLAAFDDALIEFEGIEAESARKSDAPQITLPSGELNKSELAKEEQEKPTEDIPY